jgi:transposase InsO family protein
MPWREGTRVSERAEMVEKWGSGDYSVAELAEIFGVSRPTVYLWIKRSESGELEDRAPIAHSCPHRTDERVAERIVATKRRWTEFGPKKVIQRLQLEEPLVQWPAPSTASRILEEHQLVKKRRPRRRTPTVLHARTRLGANESGEMMTIDHKGQFKLGNGEYCFPLTMNDPVSRYVYAIAGARSTAHDAAKTAMEAVFREYGVPLFIGSDNGGPFCCSRALAGLSRLSAWWIRLGITPVRIHPKCPWENGIHERMHRTLKAHTTKPPAESMRGQQARFDTFRRVFNHERPHDALEGQVPAQRLKRCMRAYPETLPPLEYPGHFEKRHVRTSGEIKWQGRRLFVSETLAGEWIGIEEIADGVWSLRYAHIELGRYDERTKNIS